MAMDRTGTRGERRAFRPSLDGGLEPRLLLSAGRVAARAAQQSGVIHYQTAGGGRVARIIDTDGELYNVTLVGGGVVYAKPLPGGRVNLQVFGSTVDTELTINPVSQPIQKGSAHTFNHLALGFDGVLHVGRINVRTGKIGQILGYRSAVLSGPVKVLGTDRVDRIAFQDLEPGAAITTGGDLNTLDVFNNANLNGGPGITVGRDLNFIDVNGNLSLNGGASLAVGRDVGLTAQPAKGTGPAGQGGRIGGDMIIGPGSSFRVGRSLDAPFVVNGRVIGSSRISIPSGAGNFVALGGFTP